MLKSCIITKDEYKPPSDAAINSHLQEVVLDLQKDLADSTFIKQQISQLIRVSEKNGWADTQYFLEMAENTLKTA